MKRIIPFLLSCLLVAGLCSCNKEDLKGAGRVGDAKTGNVFFEIGLATKAAAQPSDENLGFVQVLLFDAESGSLEAYGSANLGGVSGAVELSGVRLDRPYVCRVVANVRDGSGQNVSFSVAGSVADVDGYVLSLPTYGQNLVPMWGTTATETVTFTSSVKTASVVLTRAASRIRVSKVTAEFPSHIASKPAAVTGMYIYKAPGKYSLGLSAPATNTYYHQTGYSAADASALGDFAPYVGEVVSSGNSITGNGTFNSPRWFMVCPHAASVHADPADATFLTIEVTIDGTPYYYGIPLTESASNAGGLRPNYQYLLSNVKLTDYGAVVPPGIIDKDAISVSLSVEEWQTGFDKEVSF